MIHGFLLIGVVISFTDPIEVEMLPTSMAIEILEVEIQATEQQAWPIAVL